MSICQRCLKNFTCAMADNTGKDCWCVALPKVPMPIDKQGKLNIDASCFCPDCLPIWINELSQTNSNESSFKLPSTNSEICRSLTRKSTD